MNEEVVVTGRSMAGEPYGTCGRCGTLFRRQRARSRGDWAREGQELCPQCYRDALRGEAEADVVADD